MRKKEMHELEKLVSISFSLNKDEQLNAQYPVFYQYCVEMAEKAGKLTELKSKLYGYRGQSTRLKFIAKEKAIVSVMKLMHGIKLYAIHTNNRSLFKASTYVFSDFNRPTPIVTLGRMEQLINAARRIKNKELFGLTAEHFQEAEENVKAFKKIMNQPMQDIKDRMRAEKQVRRLVTEMKKQIDNQIIPFLEIVKGDDRFNTEIFTFYSLLKMKKAGRPKGSTTDPNRKAKVIKHKDLNLVEMVIESQRLPETVM